jgi:hypothetical protein
VDVTPTTPVAPLITAGLLRAFLTDSVPDETAIVVERPDADGGVSTEAVAAVAFAMRGEGVFSLVLRTS